MALQEEFEKQGNFLFRYRSYFPLAFLPVAVLVFRAEVLSGNSLLTNVSFWWLALGIGLAGLFVRVFTVAFTPKNTSGRNTEEGQVADELNETGIYSLVRHPLYVGNFLMWLAIAMLTANTWFIVAFTLLYWLYYERIMYAEEAFLRGKFGDKYLKWAEDKPAFVPKFKIPVKPKYSFSFKKVLKKEKNGAAALFILFYLFDVLKSYFENGHYELDKNVWYWGFVISLSLYLVLKVLKKFTGVFDEEGR